jgi:prevent-host-death family protein
MHTWQLQEAKSRFSEIVERSLTEGPQMVTRRGVEAVVILAADEYRRISGQTPRLMDCLLNAPRGEAVVFERSPEAIQDIAL